MIFGSKKKEAARTPCAACKCLRRKCDKNCTFAPYFPAQEPHKFAIVHKIYGASNVQKMLQEVEEEQRQDAVSSMVYEATARIRDPVYGCAGAIEILQQQVIGLQSKLAEAQAEAVQLTMRHNTVSFWNQQAQGAPIPSKTIQTQASPSYNMDIMMMMDPNNINNNNHYNPMW
ncbi:hypothetical protein RJT34_02547 [Clitoria ternatea]|uniref:LOB domain-containing protein n=1 Tax=Clitoria ternatea TaxID=43366 RepID=A0AAN9KHC3_CLITE